MKITAHKTFKNKFDQIRAGIKFIYRQNTSMTGYSVFRQTTKNISPPIKRFLFFTLRCKRMYFQSRKHTNIIILFWQEIHSFVRINIATKHPRALICVYNRIGCTHFGNCQRCRTIARKTGSPFVQFISREISLATSSLSFSTRNSTLEIDPRDSRLDTRNYRVSSLESRGLRDCQLTFERYCM